jgi:hypothetical protein
MRLPNRNASISGLVLALGVAASIVAGSNGLAHFDAALTGYALASLLAAFAVGYRLMVWAERPPSRMYFKRGLQLIFQRAEALPNQSIAAHSGPPLPYGAGTLTATLARNFVAQEFIRRRSSYRWIMHLCLSGGCSLAFAITFPLVFGWIHFESSTANAEVYRVMVFGHSVDSVNIHTVKAFLMFNALNIAAVLVLIGLVMAAFRRLTDVGERATQTFVEDILPLLLIFAVTITGLALTVSYKFLHGQGHGAWAVVHMITVAALLLYIPFGKLFHMFQRVCALCVSRYKRIGQSSARAYCRCCGEDYGSQMHVDDLKVVLDQLGFSYRFAGPQGELHYQDICPACRRRRVAFSQGQSLGR